MPWIFPSHQAPVLPLARLHPRLFSGLGLVLGSVAPDLVFIARLDANGSPASHSLLGQLYLTVPIVLALHLLLTGLVLPWLLPHLPGGGPLHLHALARVRTASGTRSLARIALSGLVGGLTHIFLDGFTHGDHSGWALGVLPWLATRVPHPFGPAPLYEALQLWLTIGFGVWALREWDRLARTLPGRPEAAARVEPAPMVARRAVQLGLCGAALAGALFAPLLRSAYGTRDVLEVSAFGFLTCLGLAATCGAAAERARLALERVIVDVGAWLEA